MVNRGKDVEQGGMVAIDFGCAAEAGSFALLLADATVFALLLKVAAVVD